MEHKLVVLSVFLLISSSLACMQQESSVPAAANSNQAPVDQAQTATHEYNLGQQLLQTDQREQARACFIRSASLGYPLAQTQLGIFAEEAAEDADNSAEKERLLEQAFNLYLSAAQQGYSLAQHNLGNLLAEKSKETGGNLSLQMQLLDRAMLWFYEAAKQNDLEGQLSLGYACRNKAKLIQDPGQKKSLLAQAEEWCSKAVSEQPNKAHYYLGLIYIDSFRISTDWAEKSALFNKALASLTHAHQAGNKDAADEAGSFCKEVSILMHDPQQKFALLRMSWRWDEIAVAQMMQSGGSDSETE